MPLTVVVGGQYGSEGKGKVAHWLAAKLGAGAAIRVGGANSGHTVLPHPDAAPWALRHLPTPAVLPGVVAVIGPGSYIDPDVLLEEIGVVGLSPERLAIDPSAILITEADKAAEASQGLRRRIGSTLSGTGSAVVRRVNRTTSCSFVAKDRRLAPFVRDTQPLLRSFLDAGGHVVLEGTQGHGLSLLHSRHYPYVTSRDTSAAAAVSEAGLSPLDVESIVLVIRSFPIRVSGASGPLESETTWEAVTAAAGSPTPISERTTVTKSLRRVAEFDADVVRRAIAVNRPTIIVLNHLDYVRSSATHDARLGPEAESFVAAVAAQIGREIDYVGLGPAHLMPLTPATVRALRVSR